MVVAIVVLKSCCWSSAVIVLVVDGIGRSCEMIDYGKKNSYVPAAGGDGDKGQFGAVSPNVIIIIIIIIIQ
jgi:hypothetical protein